MAMKQIKVTEEVKQKLDTLALDKETYNLIIQRLIIENEQLKEDKDKLMKIAMKTEDSVAFPTIEHSTVFLIMNVLSSIEYTEEERLEAMKIYLKPNLDEDSEAVKSIVANFEDEYNIKSPLIAKLLQWLESEY